MKIKTTKLLKFIILNLCFIFFSCEKEVNNDAGQLESAPFKSKSLNSEELPENIRKYIISDKTNNSARSSESFNGFDDAIFATQNIVKTTDDQNITNYSISFIYEDTPENVFIIS